MLKIILLLIALWLAVRFVGRVIRITANVERFERSGRKNSDVYSSGTRRQPEETEYEVIESQIKQKE